MNATSFHDHCFSLYKQTQLHALKPLALKPAYHWRLGLHVDLRVRGKAIRRAGALTTAAEEAAARGARPVAFAAEHRNSRRFSR